MKKYPYVAIKRVVDSKDRAVGFLSKCGRIPHL